MKIWRSVAATIVWTGVATQFWLMVHDRPPPEAAQAMVKFFSYFTVLSNIAVGTVLAAPVLAPKRWLGRWAARAGSRVAVGVYIVVTAGIYHALLADLWRPTGLQLVADVLLHTITLAVFLADFLAFPPPEAARWGSAWKVLLFPLAYGAWSLAHGAVSGFYPYPFLDVAKRGYGAVLVTMAILGVGFYVLALAFTGLQHLQRRLTRATRAPISA